MTTPADRFSRLVASAVRAMKDVEALAPAVVDAQWSPSRRLAPKPTRPDEMQDAGIRAKGTVSDPVGETAVDLNRHRVRREVRTAEKHMLQALALLNGVHAALDRALSTWEGEPRR